MTQYATGVSNGGQHAQYDVHLAGWDNTDLGSPTYSFPASQTSSGEAAQNVWQHEQPEKATSAASFVTQGSNRGFSLSNMIPKMLKKSGEQKKTAVPSSTEPIKVPKRRGPKPDAKPAKTRRQELNRNAQRVHRERKEMHLKETIQENDRLRGLNLDLEQRTRLVEGLNTDLEQRCAALQTRLAEVEQFLNSNNIVLPPNLITSNATSNANDPLKNKETVLAPAQEQVSGNLAFDFNDPVTFPASATSADAYTADARIYTANNDANGLSTLESGQPLGTAIANPNVLAAAVSTPIYEQPTFIHPNFIDARGVVRRGIISPKTFYQALEGPRFLPAFVNPYDLKWINFVLDLESTCNPHLELVYALPAGENYHNFMLTGSNTLRDFNTSGGSEVARFELNGLLFSGIPNKEFLLPEIKPIVAARIIMDDGRFHYFTDEDFMILQAKLKAECRCYGFGAAINDWSVIDALNDMTQSWSPAQDLPAYCQTRF